VTEPLNVQMPHLTLSDIASILNLRSPSDPHRTVSGFGYHPHPNQSDIYKHGSEK
jgi:hypothetical protein